MPTIPSDNQKNWKALFITLSVHALLLLVFFLFAFAVPGVTPPPVEEGIEVNLGNSDIGFGDIQPLVPGEPAPEAQPEPAPSPAQTAPAEQEQEKELSDRDDADAPEISKPATKPVKTTKPAATTQPATTNKPAVTTTPPTPKPQKPKAVYGGGSGTGGNNADDYNNSRNQGVAGGSGDQGKPGGNPNSDNYNGTGGSGSGGPRVTSGNRKIVKYYSFTGELDKATIYAIVRVSPAGKGTFVGFGKNSTSRSQAYANAIISYLPNIQFNPSSEESTVTVQFNFNVKD
jgi:outer membrane biosynthesis protein TonB